jgi:DNA invertase Pin-like site-specific DNA recombinase
VADRVALYLRVSTDDQDLAGQERDLRAYSAAKGWVVGCTFAEKTSAAGKVERQAWQELREEACLPMTRRFEHVLVWALDRWSREPSFVRAVGSIEDLELLGIRFHSFREPTLDSGDDDSPNLARDLLRGILPTIAAFEARRRSDRTRVAMREIREGRRATRSGRPVGRPRRVTPGITEKALKLHEEGYTWKEVAQRVGLPRGTARNAASSLKRARRHAQNTGSERKGPAQEEPASDIVPEL